MSQLRRIRPAEFERLAAALAAEGLPADDICCAYNRFFALEEIYTVATRSLVALPADTVAKTLAFIDGLPPDGTASMQRDIMEGRPSELEAQVGAVVRLGEQLDVPVPAHRRIYEALLPLELRARGQQPVARGG